MLGALESEAMELFTGFRILGEVRDSGVSPSLKALKP